MKKKFGDRWFTPEAVAIVIHDFYKRNNLAYGGAMPLNAVCKAPYKQIRQAFGHNAPTTYGIHMYSEMLNIFFEMEVVKKDYEESRNGKRYEWVMDAKILGDLYKSIKDYNEEGMRDMMQDDVTEMMK